MGIKTVSSTEPLLAPVSSSTPAMVPAATVEASEPLDIEMSNSATETNAATGKDRKLAADNPMAASSASQKSTIKSPRRKFSGKPASR